VGEADENEFLDPGGAGSFNHAFHVTDVCLWQKSLRTGREEDSRKMHNAIDSITRLVQSQRFREIRFPNRDIGVDHKVGRQRCSVL
jgi:hypothetical protein